MPLTNPLSAGSSGSALTPTAVKTANYTAVSGDLVRVDTTSGARTITLPTAAAGATVGVKLVTLGAGNAVTIAAAGADVFNKAGGSTTLTLSLLNQGVVLAADSGVWVVQADDLALTQLDGRYQPTSGTLASRPAATGSKSIYLATDDGGGTSYLDTGSGVWTALASGVIPTAPGPAYNVAPQNFKKWRAALSKVRAGTANAKILCIGDSTTEGQAATTFAQNYPSILSGLLNSYYVPAVQSFAFGNAGGTGPFDARITLGTNWSRQPMGNPSIAFGFFQNTTSTSTGTLAYAPTHQVDSFTIYYLNNSAPFTWNVDGGADTTITPSGAQSIGSTTVSAGALGTHTLNIKHVNGNGNLFIVAIDGYNSATSQVKIGNSGIGGTKTADYVTTGFPSMGVLPTITALAPDLTIIMLGINDAGASVATATYQANLQTVITTAQGVGDVLLLSMVPSQGTPYTTVEPTYLPILAGLAASNNCGYLDMFSRWVSYTSANGLGYFAAGDSLHPSTFGYSDVAQAVFNVLKTI